MVYSTLTSDDIALLGCWCVMLVIVAGIDCRWTVVNSLFSSVARCNSLPADSRQLVASPNNCIGGTPQLEVESV